MFSLHSPGAMSENNNHNFVAWEEHIICPERGKRVVHFYLKDASGDFSLAVIGTEPSIRHMLYVVPDNFLDTYGTGFLLNGCTKWRARREVVEWLSYLASQHHRPLDYLNSQENDLIEASGSLKLSVQDEQEGDREVPRILNVQKSDIVLSGSNWICAKQLEHYPAFSRNGITIAVHSFVFIMAEEKSHYLGYLEDLYEDKKGQKKVKVRWFHLTREVKGKYSHLKLHPREVFITPHVQAISAECIDGVASVLTPKHYEKCLDLLPNALSHGAFMCFRQLQNKKVTPFDLNKLRGYSNQTIISHLINAIVSQQKSKHSNSIEQEGKEFSLQDSVKPPDACGVTNPTTSAKITKCESTHPKLKFKLSKTATDLNMDRPKAIFPLSLRVNEKLEFLCQDSGIRGCWFKCEILKTSKKMLKIQYDDLEDDGNGNLKEWVLASKVAALDTLGIRCPGRLTIRPRPPPEASKNGVLTVGTPVDAWWCDGWWEGVVTRIDNSTDDSLQVFFPGEKAFHTAKKTDVRTSRDWVNNTWVDLKAKHDVLACISQLISPITKHPSCSTAVWKSEHHGSADGDFKDNAREKNKK